MSQYNLWLVCTLSLLLWLLEGLNFFSAIDHAVYDRLVVLSPSLAPSDSRLLLIDIGNEPTAKTPDQWQILLQAVAQHKPAVVGFTFMPPIDLLSIKALGLRVVIGLSAEEYPAQTKGAVSDEVAILRLPPLQDGGFRFADIQHNGSPAFSALVARSVVPDLDLPQDDRLRINFNQQNADLAIVNVERAMSGLIPELVTDKIVLIGLIDRQNRPGLATPIHQGDNVLSLTEFEAYTIQTLINGTSIQSLVWGYSIVIFLLVSLVSLFAFRRLTSSTIGKITALLSVMTILVAWFLLHWALFWIPVFSILLMQWLVFLVLVNSHQRDTLHTLQEVLLNTGHWARGHLLPEVFYQNDNYWAQVVGLIDQSIELQRFILLERIPGDHRLKEIISVRCSIDDIQEVRRDYERTPYSTAITKGGPLRLTRSYLKAWDEPEHQYLIPLSYSNQILGFWALSVSPDVVIKNKEFESLVRDFSVQIAEIIFHREIRQEEIKSTSKRLLISSNQLNQRVIANLDFLERRWSMMEQVLGDLHTCVVLYDPFGAVLNANHSMENLAKKYKMSLYELSALEFFIRLTQLSQDKGRAVISAVLFEKKDFLIPLSLVSDEINVFVLSIKPIEKESRLGRSSQDATPFDIRGILFEVFDASLLGEGCGMKSNFMDRLMLKFSDDLQIVMTSLQLVANAKVNDTQRQHIVRRVFAKIGETSQYIREAREMVMTSMHALLANTYPIDTLAILKYRLDANQPKLLDKRLTFTTQFPHILALGLGRPNVLPSVLDELLQIQINDVESDSTIKVEMVSLLTSQIIKISGEGYGMPSDSVQRVLYQDDEPTSDELRRLKKRMAEISEWGGELRVSCELGEGWVFELELESVI